MKISRSYPLLFIILQVIFISSLVFSQTKSELVSIKGQLLQSAKKEGGAYFLIGLYDTSKNKVKGTITDSLGYFLFDRIPSKEYNIGLQDSKNNIVIIGSVKPGQEDTIDLGQLLVPEDFTYLKEVIINSSRPLIQRKLDKLIVSIGNSSVLAGNTLAEILPKLPGIRMDEKQEITLNGKSGILLLIDGKGQYVSKEQLDVLLSSYKAEAIDKIEIISNPSAKYDANGTGVINIITNQNKMISDIHQSFGQQLNPVQGVDQVNKAYYSVGTALNLGFNKFKTFTNIDYSYKEDYQENEDNLFYGSTQQSRLLHSSTNGSGPNVNTRFGFNADLSKRTTLDGTLSLSLPLHRHYQRKYLSSYFSPGLDSTINSAGFEDAKIHNNTLNLRVSQILNEKNKQEIAFSMDINDFLLSSNQTVFSNLTTNQYTSPDYQDLIRDFKTSIVSFKTDYSTRLKNDVLEAGGKFSLIRNNNDYNTVIDRNNAVSRSKSDFIYQENVAAGYLNYIKHHKKLDIQAGLRVESTFSKGVTSLLMNDVEKRYINLFPSVALQYSAGEKGKHQFSLTYNKRIVRPGLSDFNPNRYLDRFTSNFGNPDLKAQFVHSGEFGYLVNGINITTYYSYTRDTKVNILEEAASLNGVGRIYNISSKHSAGINGSIPVKFTNRWTSFNSIDLGATQSSLLSGERVSYLNYSIQSSQNIQFSKRVKADVNLFYLPETRFNYGKLHEVVSISAGLRATTLNNRLSLNLNMSDILGRNRYHTTSQFSSVQQESISLRNDRNYRLTARYTFNTGKAFSIRNKKSKNDNSEVRLN